MFDDDDETAGPQEPDLPQPETPDPGKEQTHGLDPDHDVMWLERRDEGDTRRS